MNLSLTPLTVRANRLMQRWGVHPQDRKAPASGTAITPLPLPEQLILPLSQHIGSPARPVVPSGARVLRSQLLATAQGRVSAPIHAPTSGTIVAINSAPIAHPSGLTGPVMVLEPDGLDQALASEAVDPFTLSPAEIAERVAAAGIVGMGGATFPSAVKLGLGHNQPIQTLVLNGGECEPYLSCDDRLMQERPEQVIDGGRIIRHAIGAERIVIGIEANKPAAIAQMQAAARDFPEISVIKVPNRYPMGSEKHLIAWLTGQEVPSTKLAADIGIVVHNVGTAAAIHRAIRWGEPLTQRIVTVAGGAVRTPLNLEVRLGTPVSALIEFCGGLVSEPARRVMGGPMMGIAITSLHVPIIKGSGGVLMLTEAEIKPAAAATPCVRCSACVSACPMGLLPLEIVARVRSNDLAAAQELGLKDCISCGTCAFVCSSGIPLVQYLNHAKGELAANERDAKKQAELRALAEARSERLQREARAKAEAAAQRKAERERARAAAKAAAAAKKAEKAEQNPA